MTTPRPRYATSAAIERAVKAWQGLGKNPEVIELSPDGTIRLAPAPSPAKDEFGKWEDRL